MDQEGELSSYDVVVDWHSFISSSFSDNKRYIVCANRFLRWTGDELESGRQGNTEKEKSWGEELSFHPAFLFALPSLSLSLFASLFLSCLVSWVVPQLEIWGVSTRDWKSGRVEYVYQVMPGTTKENASWNGVRYCVYRERRLLCRWSCLFRSFKSLCGKVINIIQL